MKVALTGGDGFLGWHTMCALREQEVNAVDIPVGQFFHQEQARQALSGATRLIHLAGVNRGTDDEVQSGNTLFAQQLADALAAADNPPPVVVYSNSIQATSGNIYGDAKAQAADILSHAANRIAAEFTDIHFTNLFGEHGKPFYNSVTATFSHILAEGGKPSVKDDKELTLLHAQDAADVLTGYISVDDMRCFEVNETVSGLLKRLSTIAEIYGNGEIPDVSTPFQRNLVNTYRSFLAGPGMAIGLQRHADQRGSFFEILRSHGGTGQTSFSTTAPGITRGNHFHRRKVERFVVLAGSARMSLRRVLTGDVVHFDVDGDHPVAIDMPTMWTHNITNTGAGTLFTAFWTDDLFDPNHPDTVPEEV